MFTERVKSSFATNEPIYTEEIIGLFPDYSRPQIFRFIREAEEKKEIVNFAKGIYYIPRNTFIGLSTITADTVIARRYLKWNGEVFGVYGGLKLQNMFSVTTQVPNIYEIVSNNESAKRREVKMDGRTFILRKSRFEINKDNANAYMIMELFNNLNGEKIDEFARRRLINFMREKGITKEQLMDVAMKFPAKALKNLIGSNILNVGMIERGLRVPKLETFIKIANVLGVTSDYLLADYITAKEDKQNAELNERIERLSESDRKHILEVIDLLIKQTGNE